MAAALLENAVRSASRPLHLGVLALGVVLGLVLAVGGAGWTALAGGAILALAVLTWAMLSVWDALFRSRTGRPEDPPAHTRGLAPEVDVAEVAPPDLQRLYAEVLTTADRVRGSMDGAGDILSGHLVEAWARCQSLVDEAGRVARRGNALFDYLRSESPQQMQKEIQELRARARQARDAGAAQAWKQAAEAKARQLETYAQLMGLYERIKAELVALESSLDEVNARVVRMSASNLDEAVVSTRDLTGRLQELDGQIGVLERAVEATLKEVAR